MCDVAVPWNVYKEVQAKAVGCNRITAWSWGIEKGLNEFLASLDSGSGSAEPQECEKGVSRAIATGARVERHRSRLRRKYCRQEPERDSEGRMLARVRLAEIRRAVSAAEWKLLSTTAAGTGCQEIATSLGITAGAVRTRLSRLRGRLAERHVSRGDCAVVGRTEYVPGRS